MRVEFSGSVHYANGSPKSNVLVRIFDRDAAGKEDDDLTVTPGLSDDMGRFSLVYEPLRYLDYHTIHLPGASGEPGSQEPDKPGFRFPDLLDVYLPYLKFNYTFNGLDYQHTMQHHTLLLMVMSLFGM